MAQDILLYNKEYTSIFACQPISPHLNIQKPYSSDLLNKLKMQGLGMEELIFPRMMQVMMMMT